MVQPSPAAPGASDAQPKRMLRSLLGVSWQLGHAVRCYVGRLHSHRLENTCSWLSGSAMGRSAASPHVPHLALHIRQQQQRPVSGFASVEQAQRPAVMRQS